MNSPAPKVATLENNKTKKSDKNSASSEEDPINKNDSKSVAVYFYTGIILFF